MPEQKSETPEMPEGMQDVHDAGFSYDLAHSDSILPDVVSHDDFLKKSDELTKSEQAREQLEKISKIDSMTGLKNKDALNEYLPQLVGRHERNVGFLFIDGNEFRKINNELSHEHGDNYIRRLGHMIGEHIDTHKRTGIDEAKN